MNFLFHAGHAIPIKWISISPGNTFIKAMKLTVILLTICCIQVSATTKAQQITLSVKNAPLEKVIEQIHQQTGYSFLYSVSYLDKSLPITVNLVNAPIDEALSVIFNGQPFSYEVKEKTIIITPKKQPVNPQPANLHINGSVVDENKQPLSGATVKVKGTMIATVTDANGLFTLTNVPENATLVISFIGYENKEIRAAEHLLVTLARGNSKLDAVQIIGYGTTTQRLSTGDVSSVKADIIAEQPVTNSLQALEGRVPGLLVTQSSGLPGASVAVQIRGQNSINASNNPLYIIDGVPFTSTALERTAGVNVVNTSLTGLNNSYSSPLNTINPNDIESIEILKDADATAIYGSRAANGVILITTKKGKKGKAVLNVDVRNGMGEVTRMPQLLNTAQYLQLMRDANANSGVVPTAATAPELFSFSPNQDFNWQKWYIGGTAKTTDAGLTLSGGNEQITFLLSGNYHNETTVLPGNTHYIRGGVHGNISYNSLNKKLNVTTSFFYNGDDNRLSGAASEQPLFSQIVREAPNYPIYDALGNYNWVPGYNNWVAQSTAYAQSWTDNLNADANLTYQLFPGIKLKANLGINKIQVNQHNADPLTSLSPTQQAATGGEVTFANNAMSTIIFEPQITYTKTILKGTLDVLAGGTLQDNETKGQTVYLQGYTSDLLLNSMNFGTVSSQSSNDIQYKYLSMFGRVTYNWDNRYIINGTLRRDGSTRFGQGRQFGTFGSVGGAWLFSNEQFSKDHFSWLSYGKLRGSYGTTGNDGIGDYQYLSLYGNTVNNYGSTVSVAPTQIGNPDYQWEVNKKLEMAIELGFLKDRILFTGTWYRNRSGNQLVGYTLPSITGFTSYTANLPALVQNKGWEFEMNTRNIQSNNFKWSTDFNLTFPQNKLLSFPGLATSSYANNYVIGQSLSVILATHYTGTDPATGNGKFEDVNGDGAIIYSSAYNNQGGDMIVAGKATPDWYGGIRNTFTYKGWQLDVFFQYVRQQGYNLYHAVNFFGTSFDNPGTNVWVQNLNYWKSPGDVGVMPKPLSQITLNQISYLFSDAGVGDASFLRLKTLSLSYSLPPAILSRLKINSLKIFLQGQNLLTITKYIGYDPENAELPTLAIPPLKQLTLGIQCSL